MDPSSTAGPLAGKVVLISGAAQGMGLSHARAVIAAGGSVVLGDVQESSVLATAEQLGSRALGLRLDVRDPESWSTAVNRTEHRFGVLSGLVNNAGVLRSANVEDTTDDDWRFTMEVNATGTFFGVRACIPALRRSPGASIVNVSSTAGLKGFAGDAAYCASKWAIRGFTKSAALELAADGVRVNSIHPGNVLTPMIGDGYQSFEHVPQGRAADPSEISALVVFLLSDQSSFCTGAEFTCDGGELSGLPPSLVPFVQDLEPSDRKG